jgi:periplasmic protein TonB
MSADALGPARRAVPGCAARVLVAPAVVSVAARRRTPALPVALGLSGLWHGAALALAVTAGIFQAGTDAAPVPVAMVSVMPLAAFDAMISTEPNVSVSPPPAPAPAPDADLFEVPDGAADAWERPGVSAGLDAPTRDSAMAVSGVPPAAVRAAPHALPAVVAQAVVAEAVQPKREKKIKQASAQPAPEVPSGTGKTAGKTARRAAGSAGAEKSLMADWGAKLRAKVNRARRYPAAAEGATGKVMLRLTVAVTGQVLAVKVRASSGHAALDRAALDAVKRAGGLPKAPHGLGQDSYSFNLPVVFTQ